VEDLASHFVPVHRRPFEYQNGPSGSGEDGGERIARYPTADDDHVVLLLREPHWVASQFHII